MYLPFNRFLIRTPYYSFNYFEKENIEKLYLDNTIQEAVYLASPVLYKELQKLLNGEIKDKKEKERIHISLYKYISRMATRSTPFGLFAGCSVGEVENTTQIVLNSLVQKHTRLDMYYLCALSQALTQLPDVRSQIIYYPNTSLYRTGNKYRYIEYRYANERRVHQISAVDRSVYLDQILEKAKKGVKISDLIDYLTKREIQKEDAVDFIMELIDSQIIISEINPLVTGGDFLSFLINRLKTVRSEEEIFLLTKELNNRINELNNLQENAFVLYEKTITIIDKLKIPYEEKFLFQVDMLRKTSVATISKEIINELQATMTFLNKITPVWKNETLTKFQQAFYDRYEDREIPLMKVLDPDLGIGYPMDINPGDISPLLDKFFLPLQSQPKNHQFTPFQSLLFSKMQECFSNKVKEIVFTDDDVKAFKENWDDLPPTLSCMFEMIKENQACTLIKFNSCGGSCGANLLARFSHMDKKIDEWVKEIAAKEQELIPDVIFAEIAHLPDSRVGNILSRPHIRDYEILYLANSDLPHENLIYMSDLMLSVRKGRLFLRSKKLNREIIPRLTTAHNYHNNPMPVYQFLCDLQIQNGRGGLHFHWSYLGDELLFLPRIRYKNTILSLATWKIKVEELKHLFLLKDDHQLITVCGQWREKNQLPRYVLLPEGDNELFVDWENTLSVRTLFSIIKKRQTISFTEFIFDSQNDAVKDQNGNGYLNECIVCFYRDQM